ncbi:UNVERIFIED_CONTAM: hypothetical protein GTU68_056979 [Idotea baltica]|nr:hypothetical protein [Idotea baltica]
MQFLAFEKDIEQLHDKLEQTRAMGTVKAIDVSADIQKIEGQIAFIEKDLYQNLSPWQRVQLSRHPMRPYSLDYFGKIFDDFTELHGDRCFGDDKAIVAGFAQIGDYKVMAIGHQKGRDAKARSYRNFGMPNPEGYRKALRLMKLAEKFNLPILTFIDTPGAYPGIEAEERGQSSAIATNLFEMAQIEVPIISTIIGEGASGGALGIGLADRILMMENTWFSVISPESCSSILWHSWDYKEQAAEQLKLTAKDMKQFQIVDKIIGEPFGGAHRDLEKSAELVKASIIEELQFLTQQDPNLLIEERTNKYRMIGFYDNYVPSIKNQNH